MEKKEKVVAIYIRANNKDDESINSIINQLNNINYYLKKIILMGIENIILMMAIVEII